ncbi:MAG: orotidine 5'-phosphate decarboxylase, partial [Rhodospirillales bacterium]|nr:orotidine 5'-phosphate decarboxylase [Rhodospirillales bacterium]
ALHETGVDAAPAAQVLRLARLAIAAGADGLVCAPTEVALLRAELGPAPLLVVPGIRPAGGAADDQARTLTPRDAAAAGADWLVVGRPITQAADPRAAATSIADAIGA